MKYLLTPWPRLLLATSLLGAPASAALAACNNPANWLESPKDGVKVLIGYDQEFYGSGFATQPSNGLSSRAFAPPLPPEMRDKSGQGSLSKDEDKDIVSYYEPNGQGGWRVCRKESWRKRDESTRPDTIVRTQKNIGGNPLLSPLVKTHTMSFTDVYLYDKAGRLQETFSAGMYDPESNAPERGLVQCFRFNDQNLLEQYVAAQKHEVCPTGEPDPSDSWRRFRYADYKGQPGNLWVQHHYGGKNGDWEDRIHFSGPFTDAKPYSGYAFVKGARGLTEILGGLNLGPKDQSDNVKYPYQDGKLPPTEYYFPKPPVPASVLTDIEQLYRYDRRRETDVLSGLKLVEFYPANVHRPRDRFYVSVGRTVRQEQYDAQGRLRRVINLGFVGMDKRNGGFYDEDLGGKISLKLKTNKIHYRVWDYDEAGAAKLVAIGWNTKLGSVLRKEPLDMATMAYGTPDGKLRWKSDKEFFKAFDFDPYAQRAYPEASDQAAGSR